VDENRRGGKNGNIFMIKVLGDDGSAVISDVISEINVAVLQVAENPSRPAVLQIPRVIPYPLHLIRPFQLLLHKAFLFA
jgi:hypothetical protein